MSIKVTYIYCNFNRVFPPNKMAPKTVEGSIALVILQPNIFFTQISTKNDFFYDTDILP
jgi:hypothetical protein